MKPVNINNNNKNNLSAINNAYIASSFNSNQNFASSIPVSSASADPAAALDADTSASSAAVTGAELDASQDASDQPDACRYQPLNCFTSLSSQSTSTLTSLSNLNKSNSNSDSTSAIVPKFDEDNENDDEHHLKQSEIEITTTTQPDHNDEKIKLSIVEVNMNSISPSAEIAATLSCGTTSATFDISSASTVSSPFSTDVEDNDEENIKNLTSLSKQPSLRFVEKFNADYDGQVEQIADRAAEIAASGSFYDCGLYQFISFMFLSIVWTVGNGWYAYVSVFSGFTPEHQCDMGAHYTTDPNDTECSAIDLYTNKTVKCTKWLYNESQMRSTIITDFDFVCDKNYYFEVGYSLEQVGYIVGTLIFSYIADIVGRRPVLIGTLVSMCVLGFLQYLFISSFTVYIVFGFVINSLACGLEAVCVTLVLEMFTTSKRTLFGIGIEVVWVIVLAAMAPLAYVIKAWKEIRLVIFVLLSALTLISPWLAHESVRWLISMGKLEQAENVVDKIVKCNKLDVTRVKRDKLSKMLADLSAYNKMLDEQKKNNELSIDKRDPTKEKVTEHTSATIKSIFKNSKFRMYVLIMALNWFATALVYDGLTYLNNFIGENIFFNWIAMNLIELPAQFVCYYVISRYGRRLTVSITLILAGITLLFTLIDIIPFFEQLTWLKLVLFVLAKFILTQSYSAVILHAPELFPTNLRSFGYGICLFSGKITSVLSPMISLYLSKIAPRLPAVIYGAISIFCGILSLYVPETLNRPLPNSIEDVCKWPRSLTPEEWKVVRDINNAEFSFDKIKRKMCTKKRAAVAKGRAMSKRCQTVTESLLLEINNETGNDGGKNSGKLLLIKSDDQTVNTSDLSSSVGTTQTSINTDNTSSGENFRKMPVWSKSEPSKPNSVSKEQHNVKNNSNSSTHIAVV